MNKYDRYFVFDKPIPYKDLLIYPVRIKNYMEFLYYSSCLMLEKNSIKDPMIAMKAISMTYMEFMFSVSDNDNKLIQLFVGLLALVLKKDDDEKFIKFYTDNATGRPLFEIDGKLYNSDDFDQLRQIIAEQNSLDLPDETIQKDVREKMEEARRFKQKINKSKTASFEEQLTALALYSGWRLEDIYDMTIRKFVSAIIRANHMIMSNIYLTASMSGMVTFKSKDVTRGWLADLEESDKYSDVKMSLESVQNKVSGEEAKK